MKTITTIHNSFTGYVHTLKTTGMPAISTVKRHLRAAKAGDCTSVTTITIDGVGHDLADLGNGLELVRNGR